MGTIEFRLIPTPGAKPEFLAAVEPIEKGNKKLFQSIASRNKIIVLEGYTRDSWALDTAATKWTPIQVESIDGRKKVPGFVDYLHERKKR